MNMLVMILFLLNDAITHEAIAHEAVHARIPRHSNLDRRGRTSLLRFALLSVYEAGRGGR